MKQKTILINLGVLAISVGFGLFFAECASRLVLSPADFLSVAMVNDDVLGAVPAPSALAGFDKWGFRNLGVPESAEIVAIGDSHTYGNTARMEDSWPYVLGRLTGKKVYNMGMGGYGPNQYLYLLQTKALTLRPKTIICGFYMGDDFENAFTITYGLEHWRYLRELPVGKVEYSIWEAPAAPPSWHKEIRVWLSRHSVLYQIAFHASFVGRMQGQFQIKNAPQFDNSVTSLAVPEANILEAFRPIGMLSRIDQEDPNVREGMRITFKLLQEMNEICRQNHIRFLVAVIPAKEMVFADYLEHNPKLPLSDVLDKLIANERIAREKTFRFLSDANISYVDTLPALKASRGNELYARTAADMHPNRNGYRVVAEATSEAMRESPPIK